MHLARTCQKYPDLCAYIPATDVKDSHYRGLWYALVHHGIKTKPWQMPGAKAQTCRRLARECVRVILFLYCHYVGAAGSFDCDNQRNVA
jgi:hypothetical protein